MALPPLKSFLAVGALMVAIPLAGAPAALAAAPAESQITSVHHGHREIAFKAQVIAPTATRAAEGAQAAVKEGLAEHERRTGTKCKPSRLAVGVKKESEHKFVGTAELRATCVKR